MQEKSNHACVRITGYVTVSRDNILFLLIKNMKSVDIDIPCHQTTGLSHLGLLRKVLQLATASNKLVRKERLELSRVAPLEPKSSASTNFATLANKVLN
jgi:hypothetical protein